MSEEAPPAGWYPNPDGTGGLRWWSGVGWTEYTRAAATATEQPAADPDEPPAAMEPVADTGAPTEVLADQTEARAEQTEVLGDQAQWPDPWGQTAAPTAPATTLGGYPQYAPLPPSPLTASRMRPLGGMFSDIGRIVRRAWLPILAIPLLVWTVITIAMAGIGVALVDLDALGRGLNIFGQSVESSPDGTISDAQLDQMREAFNAAFARLSPGAWAAIVILLVLLMLLASVFQTAAVSRLSMDAAASEPVRWSAGWRSGLTGGLRLLGYWLLFAVIIAAAMFAITAVIALVATVAPPVAVLLGLIAFFATIALAFWLVGRLVPIASQAVIGRHALRWSWAHTKGKFWAVIGRYLLWSIAASIIIQALSAIIAIPASLLFIGEISTSSSLYSQFGTAMALQVVLLPISAALGSITVLGITPIWRDLTDHPVYRSIDDSGNPIVTPT